MRIRWRVLAVGLLGAVGVGGLKVWMVWAARGRMFEELGAVPARAVAVVLGARVYGDGTPSPALWDRLEAALALYRAGRVDKVLVSGDHGNVEYDEVNAMWRWLADRGVRAEDLASAAGIDAVGVVADRRLYPGGVGAAVREVGARVVAAADVWVLGTTPRHLGAAVDIAGDGRVTHDRWTGAD